MREREENGLCLNATFLSLSGKVYLLGCLCVYVCMCVCVCMCVLHQTRERTERNKSLCFAARHWSKGYPPSHPHSRPQTSLFFLLDSGTC